MLAPLPMFFVLAFGWTWAWQTPLVLGYQGPLWLVFLGLGAIGPSLAAIVVSRGRVLRDLRSRARWWWFVMAAGVPIAVQAVVLVTNVSLGASMPAVILTMPAFATMILPAFGEELGWRGFAYPRMADATSPAAAAVITGLLWGLWHLPTALLPGAELSHFPIYLAVVTAVGIWMAWLYEVSGRRVTVAIVAHGAINAGLIARTDGLGKILLWTLVGAASLVVLYGRRRSPRGRILGSSYENGQTSDAYQSI